MKSYVVIGLGRFGSVVAKTLYDLGYEVLGIDFDEAAVQSASEHITHAISANATDETVLNSLGVRNFDVGIVAIGENMETSILLTVQLKDLGVPFIVSKAKNELHAKVLEKVGANKVVFPERDMGVRLANILSSNNIVDYIELSPDYGIVEIAAPVAWLGKPLEQLDLRNKHGVNIIAIKRGEAFNVSPTGSTQLQDGDIVVMVGETNIINQLASKNK